MTKKTKLLLTSFATIAMSASLVVGGTYALFTSETKVDISVKAGQVKMTATADNFKVYSGKWNSSTKVYDDELQSGLVFANGGVVTVNDKNNVIDIDRMTPTDMVEFDIHVENESDVTIQYQTILTPVEGTDTKLYDVLDVTIDGVTYEATAAYSNWQILQPGTDVDVTVSVKMPWDVGNEYQGLTASFAYVVKAVQGNADTAYYFNDDVVLKGQTYTIESDTEQDFAFNIEGAQNVQLTDMNYQFTNYWYGVHMKNVANATLTNVTAETNIGMPVYATRGTNATLNNVAATTHSNDPSGWPNSAFAAAGSSVVTINGGTYVSEHGAAVYAFNSGAEITINDGTFTGKTAAVWADGNALSGAAMNSHIIIKGGTFKGAIREEQGGEITIYGGTFDTDPTAFVAEGYKAEQNADGTYGVKISKWDDVLANATVNADGAKEIALPAGELTLPKGSMNNAKVVFSGTKDTVVDLATRPLGNGDINGADLTFDGVTVKFGKENYKGLQHAGKVVYKNCKIIGLQFLYADSVEFVNCEFDANGAEHCVWTYSAKNIAFTDCTFNYNDRGLNLYCESGNKQTVTFTRCTFNTTNTNSQGAVEINSSTFSDGIYATLTDCVAPAYGEMAYVSPWDKTNGAKTVIIVDGKVASNGALLKTIQEGETSVELLAGEYQMPDGSDLSLRGKTLTVKGTKDTVIDVSNVDERDQFVTGATLTFEGVTLNFGTALYMGFANTASLLYKDCVINGVQHLYGQNITFEGCTLNVEGDHYMVRTWGGKNVTFNGCTFNCDGKAILVYNQSCNLTVNNCKFNDNGTIADKAAIEVCNGDNGPNCVTHNIVINNTTVNGFDINPNGINTGTTLWANKNSLDKQHLTVIVDGVKAYGE